MTETFVLDSFAVLALLGREPGSQEVAKLLRKAQEEEIRVLMTWVNAGEVAYIVERRWGLERLYAALAMLEATALEIVPVERELALMAAHIKAEHAIAYADAFAAALAKRNAATPVTSDPAFKLLEGILDIHWLPQQESKPFSASRQLDCRAHWRRMSTVAGQPLILDKVQSLIQPPFAAGPARTAQSESTR